MKLLTGRTLKYCLFGAKRGRFPYVLTNVSILLLDAFDRRQWLK